MKTKTTQMITLLSFLLSASALASQMPNPLAELHSNNGPVSPIYQTRRVCRIYSDYVFKSTSVGARLPLIKKTQVAWTQQVPNAQALTKLVNQAVKGRVTKDRSGPVGGSNFLYLGIQTVGAGAPKPTTLLSKGTIESINQSPAAAKIVKFLDFNCIQQ